MCKGIGEHLSKLDMMSGPCGLTVNGKTRFTFVSGALFTALALFITLMSTVFQFYKFQQRDVLGSNQSLTPAEILPALDIRENRLFPYVRRFGSASGSDVNKFIYVEVEFSANFSRPGKQIDFKVVRSQLVPCSELPVEQLKRDYAVENIEDSILNNKRYICVNSSHLESLIKTEAIKLNMKTLPRLEIVDAPRSWGKLNLNIWPCDPVQSQFCQNLTEEERKKYISEFGVEVYYVGKHVDTADYKNPIKYTYVYQFTTLKVVPESTHEVTMRLASNYIEDDLGIPFGKRRDQLYATTEEREQNINLAKVPVNCTKEQREVPSECARYSSITVEHRHEKNVNVLTRKFQSVLDMLGTIGGINTLV